MVLVENYPKEIRNLAILNANKMQLLKSKYLASQERDLE